MSNNIICPYCDTSNSNSRQYCKSCGKLVQLSVREPLPQIISTEQIMWILIGGYSVYFILRYFIQLEFSVIILISALASFIMIYRLFMISGENKIQDFFPYWKQFFVIAGILIWLIEILSMFTFNITHSISIKEIVLNFIIPFSWEFSQGYAIGVIAPLFYYYFKNKYKR